MIHIHTYIRIYSYIHTYIPHQYLRTSTYRDLWLESSTNAKEKPAAEAGNRRGKKGYIWVLRGGVIKNYWEGEGKRKKRGEVIVRNLHQKARKEQTGKEKRERE